MVCRCLRGCRWFCVLFLAGCTSSSGGFFPEGQQLLKETRELRNANPVPVPLPRELAKQLAPSFVIEPGDILLIQPADFDSPVRIPGDQPVLPDGSIHLGKFGRVIVAGLTVEQIEELVRDLVVRVVKDAGPITVRVVSRQSKVFYVLGEVNSPGAYPLAGRETVLDAILVAGGVNTRADLTKVTLSRPSPPDGCRAVLPIAYEEIVQIGDTSTNYQIANGDRIFIPTKTFFGELCHHFGGKKKSVPFTGPHTPCTSVDDCGCVPHGSWAPAHRTIEGPVLLSPPTKVSASPKSTAPRISNGLILLPPLTQAPARSSTLATLAAEQAEAPSAPPAESAKPRGWLKRLTSAGASDQINHR